MRRAGLSHQIHIVAPSEYLERGETVEIPIVIEVDTPLSRVRNITAKFHGAERAEAEYTVTTTDSDGNSRTETRTAVEYHDIVVEEFILLGQPTKGFFGGLMDSMATLVGGGSGTTLDRGRHEFSVSATIPHDAPPTLDGRKCRIFYTLTVTIDRALARDPKEEFSFRVVPRPAEFEPQPVVARYPGPDGHGFWERMFGKQAQLTLVLDRDTVLPGDEVECMLGLEAGQPISVRCVEARVLCREATQAGGHTDSYTHAGPWLQIYGQGELPGEFSHRFTLPVEFVGPPSTTAHVFNVDWFIQVNFDVPWAADPNIQAPLRVVLP